MDKAACPVHKMPRVNAMQRAWNWILLCIVITIRDRYCVLLL